jgi:hypothetical protein
MPHEVSVIFMLFHLERAAKLYGKYISGLQPRDKAIERLAVVRNKTQPLPTVWFVGWAVRVLGRKPADFCSSLGFVGVELLLLRINRSGRCGTCGFRALH